MDIYAYLVGGGGLLEQLGGFARHFGADFCGLPRNDGTITLVQKANAVPTQLSLGKDDVVIPIRAGEMLRWELVT